MSGSPALALAPTSRASSVTVTIASAGDASEWDAFVASHRDATGYHVWAWRDVFTRAFGHQVIYLLARSGGAVVGVLPLVYIQSAIFGRSLTSLPFLNYGGTVADDDAVSDALLEAAAAAARERRCRHVELRHLGRRYAALAAKQHKVTMKLRLADTSWERLDRKVRNQIRKAQKSGLTSEDGGIELLRDFYTVFARNMRDLGTPVYGRRFFQTILETFPDRTRVHVVRLDGAPIAAVITYATRGDVEVPWASSIREHNSLCPNHLLYGSVIERALATGCDVLDFGRSTPHEGTYKFKEQWGAEPVALHWEYWLEPGTDLPDTSPANAKYRMAIALWKKLPLAIASWIGPAVVKSIP
jgi:FemAB-related protein (PEP-CTERM system-associated)